MSNQDIYLARRSGSSREHNVMLNGHIARLVQHGDQLFEAAPVLNQLVEWQWRSARLHTHDGDGWALVDTGLRSEETSLL